jgi:putative transposase
VAGLLTACKRQAATGWLPALSRVPLHHALRHLERALHPFFEGRATDPPFQKQRGPHSATSASTAFSCKGTALTLAQRDHPVAGHWSRPLPTDANPPRVRSTTDPAGRYGLSFLGAAARAGLPISPKTSGMDLGVQDVVRLSTGEKTGPARFFRQDAKRWARA